MFPTEMEILLDITKNKDSGKQLMSRPMDVVSEYICYLCDSLVRRGYIKGNKTKGYRLTSMGREILAVPAKNEARVKQAKATRIEYRQELDKLLKERLKASREAEHSI